MFRSLGHALARKAKTALADPGTRVTSIQPPPTPIAVDRSLVVDDPAAVLVGRSGEAKQVGIPGSWLDDRLSYNFT